jgi:carboxypeptidase C (cathepsin A)
LLTPWKINNEVKGFYKKVGKLELRTINNGGHLIPMDQGEVALNMLNSFVQSAMGGQYDAERKVEVQ